MWNIFSCAYLPSVYCLWWGVCKATSPFLINVCHYGWVLRVFCIFWIISDMSSASTFSHAGLTSQEKCLFFFFMKIKIFLDSSCVIYVQMLFCHSWAIIYQHFYVFLQFGAHWIKKKHDNVTSSFQILGSTSLFRFEHPITNSIFTQRT